MWFTDDLGVTTVSRTLAFGRLNMDPHIIPDHDDFWRERMRKQGDVDLVKRSVLTLVSEIWHYTNYHYYYYDRDTA